MELTQCYLKGRAFFFILSEVGISYSSYVNIVNTKKHQSPGLWRVCVFASSNSFTFSSFVWYILLKEWWLDSNFSQFMQPLRWEKQTRLYTLKLNLYGDVSAVIYCGRNKEPQNNRKWYYVKNHINTVFAKFWPRQSVLLSALGQEVHFIKGKTVGTDNPQANSVQFC